MEETTTVISDVRSILTEVLQIGERGKSLTRESELLGNIPELDSMAVVTVVTTIEEHYGIEFDDDDFSAESFATLGSLSGIVEEKVRSA